MRKSLYTRRASPFELELVVQTPVWFEQLASTGGSMGKTQKWAPNEGEIGPSKESAFGGGGLEGEC